MSHKIMWEAVGSFTEVTIRGAGLGGSAAPPFLNGNRIICEARKSRRAENRLWREQKEEFQGLVGIREG